MVLVCVLSASTRCPKPSVTEISFRTLVILIGDRGAKEDRNGYGRGMNAPTFFGWGCSLDSMTADFEFKFRNVGSINRYQRVGDNDMVLSALG